MPTARQFLAVTQDTPSRSRAGGGEAAVPADADPRPVTATPSTTTTAISADAMVLYFNSAPRDQGDYRARRNGSSALSAPYAHGRHQEQSRRSVSIWMLWHIVGSWTAWCLLGWFTARRWP